MLKTSPINTLKRALASAAPNRRARIDTVPSTHNSTGRSHSTGEQSRKASLSFFSKLPGRPLDDRIHEYLFENKRVIDMCSQEAV